MDKGTECPECHGKCELELAACPLEFIDDDVIQVMHYAELYEKGLPPLAGGALDQAMVFTEACRYIWHEAAEWKRKLKIFDMF